MTPWVVDATNIIIKEVESFRTSLMHGNDQIVDFLASDNKTEMLIVAPKGYGKTLLLKAKRQAVQHEGQYAHILPDNNLVDKPFGVPNIAHKQEAYRQHEDYWKILWTAAICMTFLKAEKADVPSLSPKTAEIWKEPVHDSACDIFTQLLQFNAGEYERLKDDCSKMIIPHTRRIRESACLFIDNVDEFFEEVLKKSQQDDGEDSVPRSFWYLAQIGVALAVRDIQAINNHLKVFVSIRKEALESLSENSAIGLQLSGSALDIKYSYTDLKQIIDKNIFSEKDKSLPNPQEKIPVQRFLVDGEKTITHEATSDEESFQDFWLRHTLRRPRDIAALGRKLSDVSKDRRTVRKAVKTIVAESRVIVRTYLAESSPHLEHFDVEILGPLLEKNWYTSDELTDLARTYTEQYMNTHMQPLDEPLHPFCHLFKLGLLGYVQPIRNGTGYEQYFPKPGEQALSGICVLPKADIYLLHPIMDAWLEQIYPAYIENKNPLNVIGHKWPWRESNHIHYVLKGDVCGYSRINRNPDRNLQFDVEFDRLCHTKAEGLKHVKVDGGDSVTLVDENPLKLILCAQNIHKALGETVFKAKMRFGGACGRVDVIPSSSGGTNLAGPAFNDAARLEPHAKPGKVFVTGAFVEQASHMLGGKPFKSTRVTQRQLPNLPYKNKQFNLAKAGGQDEDVWKELFSVSVVNGDL